MTKQDIKEKKIKKIKIWREPKNHVDRDNSTSESLDSERPEGKNHYSLFHSVDYQIEMLALKLNEIIDKLNKL